jgi:hypothetical protein
LKTELETLRLNAARNPLDQFTFSVKQQAKVDAVSDGGSPVEKSSRSRSCYKLHINMTKLPLCVNPRDTLCAALLSEKSSQKLFNLTLRNKCVLMMLALLNGSAQMITILGLCYDSSLGWYTVLGFPPLILSFIQLNREILKALIQTFEWWAMIIANIIVFVSLIDAVKFDPPRVVIVLFVCLSLPFTLCLDSRSYVKRASKITVGYWIYSAGMNWALLILWWSGKWIDAHQTRIPISGALYLDVQSIGFSAYLSICVIMTKYMWVMLASKETNQCMILKAGVSYRYYQAELATKSNLADIS